MKLVLIWGVLIASLAAQEPIVPQPMKAVISNLDKEPAPYIPDSHLRSAASHDPTLAEMRRASAPGMTLGEIEDRKELIQAIANSGAIVIAPIYIH